MVPEIFNQVKEWGEVELVLLIPNSEFGEYRVWGNVLSVNESGILLDCGLKGMRWILWPAVALMEPRERVDIKHYDSELQRARAEGRAWE